MDNVIIDAKNRLDTLIAKALIQFYKPIQIAEILYRDRVIKDIDIEDLESYRSASKHWRDRISELLLGRVSTSSARFQDNLFDTNAIPPQILSVLSLYNKRSSGAVEAYIYQRFSLRLRGVKQGLSYCTESSIKNFDLETLLNAFWSSLELRRSIDKIYEIVVYALLSAVIDILEVQVQLSVKESRKSLLSDFEELTDKVLGLNVDLLSRLVAAKLYRVGTTNAADRGVDIWGNFGTAIQVKHLSLDVQLAESISNSIRADRLIIVCKEADKLILNSIIGKLGTTSIQSIITAEELKVWYKKAMSLSDPQLGNLILERIKEEVSFEFPSISTSVIDHFLEERRYLNLNDDVFSLNEF